MEHYERMADAIEYLAKHSGRQPSLDEVARHAAMSPFHFQRVFSQWAGVSPKRFLQFLTAEHAKRLLDGSKSLLDASYEAGLSGPSRLHDLFVSVEGVTPGEFKERGAGLELRFGFHPTPFGECLLALSERGVTALRFVAGGGRSAVQAELAAEWPEARLALDPAATAPVAERLFALAEPGAPPFHVLLKGTNFQLKVWKALLEIEEGHLASYGQIARAVGQPSASRAVGAAIARNPVAVLIPCHRVIRDTGALGGYRWGGDRKRSLIAWESARAEARSLETAAGS